MQTLGERIAAFRKENGMTQEQLAEKCSVSAQAVSKWENDLTAPDISLLPRLAELFHKTTDELLGVRRAETVAVNPDTVDISKMLLKVRAISDDGDKMNLNLPLSVAEILLKNEKIMERAGAQKGGMELLSKIDFAQIVSLVQICCMGKLMEAESADGSKIEVWVE